MVEREWKDRASGSIIGSMLDAGRGGESGMGGKYGEIYIKGIDDKYVQEEPCKHIRENEKRSPDGFPEKPGIPGKGGEHAKQVEGRYLNDISFPLDRKSTRLNSSH